VQHFFAFDVLGEIAFSRKFGFLESGTDLEGAIKTIDEVQRYDGIIGQIPEWDFALRRNPLAKFLPGMDPSKSLITRMALEELGKRKKYGEKVIDRKDLLSHLMAANEKAPDVFKEGDVFAIAHGAMSAFPNRSILFCYWPHLSFAGSDSTASTMQSFYYHVLRDSAIYTNLKDEIDRATTSGTLSRFPQWNETQALPYFQACLKEAMRIRPAVGLNITRMVPPEGAEIGGKRFPGGTRVAVNGWVLHRNEEIFGADPKVYRPERWLEGDAKNMERYMFQFGGGSHVCESNQWFVLHPESIGWHAFLTGIGKNLALLEMNKTLPLLFRDYDLELLRPHEELKYHSTFFVVQHGLHVKISKRAEVWFIVVVDTVNQILYNRL
jgi:hypothetical protein